MPQICSIIIHRKVLGVSQQLTTTSDALLFNLSLTVWVIAAALFGHLCNSNLKKDLFGCQKNMEIIFFKISMECRNSLTSVLLI